MVSCDFLRRCTPVDLSVSSPPVGMFELVKLRLGAQELRGVKRSVRIAILFQIGSSGNRSFKAESDLTSPVSWHFLCSGKGDVAF